MSAVEIAACVFPARSAVRAPCERTADTASSTHAASFSNWNECRSNIATAESLPADSQCPSPQCQAPTRAPAHTIPRARQCSPMPAVQASPQRRQPGPRECPQTYFPSAAHRHPQAAAPAASPPNPRTGVPASPRDIPSPRASQRRATAANTRARWPCRPTEPCDLRFIANSNATRAMRSISDSPYFMVLTATRDPAAPSIDRGCPK